MTNRTERREEIKLILEYVKLATSFAVVGTVYIRQMLNRQQGPPHQA